MMIKSLSKLASAAVAAGFPIVRLETEGATTVNDYRYLKSPVPRRIRRGRRPGAKLVAAQF